jgi:hypothetical protein
MEHLVDEKNTTLPNSGHISSLTHVSQIFNFNLKTVLPYYFISTLFPPNLPVLVSSLLNVITSKIHLRLLSSEISNSVTRDHYTQTYIGLNIHSFNQRMHL